MSHLPITMQAVLVRTFGGIDHMDLEQLPIPLPGPGQVLVKVHAAGVGPWDGWVRLGKSALHQPLPLVLGADLSGLIEAIGPDVQDLEIGDAVFGVTNSSFTGAYAGYALAEARMITLKPSGLGYIEAAALPVVSVTAWTMVNELGRVKTGDRVLIHGGAGNVGSYAVQFAKRQGAYVAATALGSDTELVEALGADAVIDFETTDFVAECHDLDLVIDTVGGDSQRRSFEVLKSGGRLVSSVSQPDQALANAKNVSAEYFIVDVTRDRLAAVTAQIRDLKIVVGEVLGLKDFRLAHEMLQGRPHRAGKIVLSVATL